MARPPRAPLMRPAPREASADPGPAAPTTPALQFGPDSPDGVAAAPSSPVPPRPERRAPGDREIADRGDGATAPDDAAAPADASTTSETTTTTGGASGTEPSERPARRSKRAALTVPGRSGGGTAVEGPTVTSTGTDGASGPTPAAREVRDATAAAGGASPVERPIPPVPLLLPRRDRNGPLREIGASLNRRRLRVAGLALAAAGIVAWLAILFPPPTVATTSVQVGSVDTTDPGPATARALASATSAAFTDRVAQLAGTTPADVTARVSVTAATPGVLTVRTTGSDEASATGIAGQAVTALTEQVGALDSAVTRAGTDPLRAELDRRDADPVPQGLPDPLADQLTRVIADRSGQATVVVPGPVPVAAAAYPPVVWIGGAAVIAGLAAGLLAALGVPAVRRGRGLLPEADPAGRLRTELDVPVLAPGRAPDIVPILAGAYRSALRAATVITVVQLTAEPACDVATELVKAASLAGDDRGYADLTPGAERVRVVAGSPVIRALRTPKLHQEDLRALRDSGPTVLAVQTAGTRPHDIRVAVESLRAVGAPPALCLVWTGRLPRDPGRVPLPADARTRAASP